MLLGKKMFRPNKLFVITCVPDFRMLFELILLVCTICTLKGHCYFACSRFSRNPMSLEKFGIFPPGRRWCEGELEELGQGTGSWIGRGASSVSSWMSLAAVNWCFQEVVAFLMPWFFVSAFFSYVPVISGGGVLRYVDLLHIYIYVLYHLNMYIYIFILRFVEDAMGYSFVDISHLFSVHVCAAHDTLSTTICIWDVYYIHNLRGIYIFIYLCLYPSLVKAHWEPRCKNSILCTGGFPQDSMEPVENNIYSIPGIGSVIDTQSLNILLGSQHETSTSTYII